MRMVRWRDWWSLGAGCWLVLIPACANLDHRERTVSQAPETKPPQTPASPPIEPARLAFADAPASQAAPLPPQTPRHANLIPPVAAPGESAVVQTSAVEASTQARATPSAELHVKPAEDPPLVSALRCYMNRRPAEAIAWLEHYDPKAQELLLALLPLVAQLAQPQRKPQDPHEMATLVSQIDGVTASLRTRADLIIDKMFFCWRIDRFGVYRVLPEDHVFHPGDRVQMYVELQNYTNERRGKLYSIRLASTLEIHKFDGELVWRQGIHDGDRPDLSQTERHDFFSNYTFTVPNIPRGLYTLRLQVKDIPTNRVATRTLDFRVRPRVESIGGEKGETR